MAAIAIGALPAAAAAQNAADFTWTMPSKFGEDRDSDRVLDYANSAKDVGHGPFPVRFVVDGGACAKGVERRWTVDGGSVEPRRDGGGCEFVLEFPDERDYQVELELTGAGPDASSTQTVVVQDLLIVAIGDSVASGEGNPDNRSFARPRWESKRCHRSAFAGVARAAGFIETADPKSSVTFVHLACSGATVPVGLVGPYKGAQPGLFPRPRFLDAQVDELTTIASQRAVDAVLLSIGGNDVGFSKIITFCLKHKLCQKTELKPQRIGLPKGPKLTLDAAVGRALDRLGGRYDQLESALPDSIDRNRLYALEYFDPTHEAPGRICPPILPGGRLESDEQEWAYNRVILRLNERTRVAADRYGWQYVDGVTDLFAGHGYCVEGGEGWVRRLDESLSFQGLNHKGTLHPNEEGHRRTAELIDRDLRPALLPGGTAREPDPGDDPPEDPGAGVVPEDPGGNGGGGGGDAEWGTAETIALGAVGGVLLAAAGMAAVAGGGRRRDEYGFVMYAAPWIGGLATGMLGAAAGVTTVLGATARGVVAALFVIPVVFAVWVGTRAVPKPAARPVGPVRLLLAVVADAAAVGATVLVLDESGEQQWLLLALTAVSILATLRLLVMRPRR